MQHIKSCLPPSSNSTISHDTLCTLRLQHAACCMRLSTVHLATGLPSMRRAAAPNHHTHTILLLPLNAFSACNIAVSIQRSWERQVACDTPTAGRSPQHSSPTAYACRLVNKYTDSSPAFQKFLEHIAGFGISAKNGCH